jgi:hypothetical protein
LKVRILSGNHHKMHINYITVLAALSAAPAVLAHSWIEQIRNIDAQGAYVGEYGYPRGYKSKSEAGYDSEKDMVWLLPPLETQPPFINQENLLCNPNQRKQVQSEKYPRLKAPAEGWLALRYAENGHVTNPANGGNLDVGRREKGGSVFVFGTTQPIEDEKIFNVLQWNKDGTGGDKRGKLLAINDFDDGRCYENNQVAMSKERAATNPNFAMGQAQPGAPGNYPLMCETNVQLPKDAETGKTYTLYWVWQWPKEPGKDPIYPLGKAESYSSCQDIDVVENFQPAGQLQFSLGLQQDAMDHAVKDFRSRTAIITDPIKGEVGDVFKDLKSAPSEPAASTANPPIASTANPPVTSTANPPAASPMPTTLVTSKLPEIPTLTKRPGEQLTNASDGNVTTVTVTAKITVTASVVPTPEPSAGMPAPAKRDFKLRRMYLRGQ